MAAIGEIKATYIFHSGFAIETASATLIFDCYTDPSGIVGKLVECGKPVYFFASHRHPDHFSPMIFEYADSGNVSYILSADIRRFLKKLDNPPYPKIHLLHAKEHYQDSILKATAMPSTDIGVSFCVEIDGKTIFHAGDLNLWHGKDEPDEKKRKEAYGNFKAALRTIKESGFSEFDLAMFPVDYHVGTDCQEGARIFVREFYVKHFIPMHFWDCPEKAINFELYANKEHGEYHALTTPSESITL